MRKPIDMVGKRFGRLTVLSRAGRDKHRNTQWLCRCDCGVITVVLGGNLRRGYTKSCGCFNKKTARDRATTHGGSGSRLYHIRTNMIQRCYNTNIPEYPRYGGRGITVCKEWRESFAAFRDWALANGYSDSLSIDRIDNEKGYSPENCRWVDEIQQANNKGNSHRITFNGETHTIAEWARLIGVPSTRIRDRLRLGWSIEKALTEPVYTKYGLKRKPGQE